MVAYKYIVESGIDTSLYNEFDTADEAIAYAKEHGDAATFVKKIEVEMNDFGEVTQEYGQEIIWQPDNTLSPEDEDAWIEQRAQEEEDKKYVDPFEADEFGDFYTNRRDNESLNIEAMVEDLENNESEVECKHCFGLFPKDECIKTEHGYLCKECASKHESLESTVEQDLNDDRTPIQEVDELLAEPFNASDMRKHEHAIKEDVNQMSLFDYTGEIFEELDENSDTYDFWGEDDLTEDVQEVNYVDYKHSYCHALQPKLRALNYLVNVKKVPVDNIKGFIFNLLKDPQVRWTEKEKEFAKNVQAKDDARDIYNYVVNSLNKAKEIIVQVNENGELVGSYRTEECLPEELEEFFNYPAIEIDDVELDGMDNAVVDCETDFKVIAHSEDEKPLDCKMEKAPLEKPLTEALTDTELRAVCEHCLTAALSKSNLNKEDFSTLELSIDNNVTDNNDIGQVWSLMHLDADLVNEGDEAKFKALVNAFMTEFNKLDWAKNISNRVYKTKYVDPEEGLGNEYFITFELYADEDIFDSYEETEAQEAQDTTVEDSPEVEEFFKSLESLEEAKKDDELPVDPEAAKLEVHTMLNDLVADEIEAINGYEEAKAEIMDTPIAHKDNILDTIDHVEDEEKEHVDELIDATTEIPFDKEEAHIEEAPVEEPVEEPIDDNPFEQEFPEAEEPAETEDSEAKVDESYPDIPFDSEVKEGDKIRIIHLSGEDTSYDGKEGVVEHIDGIGQLHGTWGGLAVIPGVDEFEVITNESFNEGVSLDNPSLKKGLGYLSRYPNKHAYVCSYRDTRTHQVVTVDRGFDTYEDLMKYIRAMEAANKNIGSFEVLYSNDLGKYYDALNQKTIK